jgi:hypothetical protein
MRTDAEYCVEFWVKNPPENGRIRQDFLARGPAGINWDGRRFLLSESSAGRAGPGSHAAHVDVCEGIVLAHTADAEVQS